MLCRTVASGVTWSMNSFIATLAGALVLGLSVPAGAQPTPRSAIDVGAQQIRGRVVTFDGRYALRVRDEQGHIDAVELHPGTIIEPTGLQLAPGMVVRVVGLASGTSLAAGSIEAPYTIDGWGVPYFQGSPWYDVPADVTLADYFAPDAWREGYDRYSRTNAPAPPIH